MLELKGRGAVVAGTRRVGRVVAERLAAEGVDLAIVYRNSRAEAESLAADIKHLPGRSILLQADLAVEDETRRVIEAARRQLGGLSFCVNMASDYPRVSLPDLDAAAWDRGMVAARAAYLLALHASRAMTANDGPTRGHLIFFGDWAADETPYTDFLPYLTAKAAIHFMTRAFAVELAPYGILANAILPGPTQPPADLPQHEWQQALREAPLHRISDVAEMAEMVVTLLKSETMTGETIRIDSGRHLAGNLPAAAPAP